MAKGPNDTSFGAGASHKGENVDKSVGTRIRARRLQVGLTIDQLAHDIGATHSQLGRMEDGLERPSPAMLLRMCAPLQCSIRLLFAGVDQALAQAPLAVLADPAPDTTTREHIPTQHAVCNDIIEIVHIYGRLAPSDRQAVLDLVRALSDV